MSNMIARQEVDGLICLLEDKHRHFTPVLKRVVVLIKRP
jgi:hypothetical protein